MRPMNNCKFIIIFILLQWPNPLKINLNYLIIILKIKNWKKKKKTSNKCKRSNIPPNYKVNSE